MAWTKFQMLSTKFYQLLGFSFLVGMGMFSFSCSPTNDSNNKFSAAERNSLNKRPEFLSEAAKFLISAERLNTMISFGISREEYKREIADVYAQFQQLNNGWPEDFLPKSRQDIASAVRGWMTILKVGGSSVGKEDTLFEELMDYAEKSPSYIRFRVVNNGGTMFFSCAYTGPDFEEKDCTIDNTTNLLAIASSYFDRGKVALSDALVKR